MAFAGFANVFAMRVNLSVAIVAMVKHSNGTEDNLNVTEIECSANLPNSSAVGNNVITIIFAIYLSWCFDSRMKLRENMIGTLQIKVWLWEHSSLAIF
jgi:hypothetical protein